MRQSFLTLTLQCKLKSRISIFFVITFSFLFLFAYFHFQHWITDFFENKMWSRWSTQKRYFTRFFILWFSVVFRGEKTGTLPRNGLNVMNTLTNTHFNKINGGFLLFFLFLLGYPTDNFQPLSRGQPHQTDVNYWVRLEGRQEPWNVVGSQSPAERLVGFDQISFGFWI